MADRPEREDARSLLGLWFGVLAGPLAWTAHLLLSYPLVPVACATGLVILLHVVTLATLAVTAAAAYVALRAWPGAEGDRAAVRGPRTGSRRFLAGTGVLLNALFGYVILMEGLPNLIIGPCR